ncbi:MAG: 16S rRNA (guanine(527)-N(7))-methyltransferase RsmG [Ruminococcus sp.]|nr:16S rRNA (guanine(527)-N(7))-methyltransferase RsmG [Ruminococcus sp.]
MLSIEQIQNVFSAAGLSFENEQYAKLSFYADILCEYNEKVNLTAITDPLGIAEKHFLDSIYPFATEDIVPQGAKLIDVGTGAGFPSCPLKIVRPDIDLTLLDSLNKRLDFLKLLSDKASLEANCIHGRAEECGSKSDMREQFDIATARAVARLNTLCEYCLPFVKVGGAFAALKGSDGKTELDDAKKAVAELGGEIELFKEYTLPCGDGRSLIVIRKIKSTPAKYPRKQAQIKNKPL